MRSGCTLFITIILPTVGVNTATSAVAEIVKTDLMERLSTSNTKSRFMIALIKSVASKDKIIIPVS